MNDNLRMKYLLEQYRLYVHMADNISKRRHDMNRFYISVISGLYVSFSFLYGLSNVNNAYVNITYSILGMTICFVWLSHIKSYKRLNEAKFKVIHNMEEKLPYPCYKEEQDTLDVSEHKHTLFTDIEQKITYVFALPFILCLICQILDLLSLI